MEENDTKKLTDELFDNFLSTVDLEPTLESFNKLCKHLDINTKNYKTIFSLLKANLKSWKCQTLFNKLEKKSKHQDYKNKPCARLKVLIIGAGPVGLRTAIEAAFLGAHVCVVEKRNSFSRNNVLHLWPFLIVDLKSLGIKSFFGKFCAGSLDHISIRRLQCILLKMCLLLGVEIHVKTSFHDVIEPTTAHGWKASFTPQSSKLNSYEYDAIVGCDGKYNGLQFKRKEFRGKLAIAITCNFINKQTSEEARVEEISGVAFIYNQEFFQELKDTTGIELENIVYYKDETHYFVMTAKKRSLLYKNVIKQDSKDVFKLLSAENVNHNALLEYAKAAADFSTKYMLPHHEFAKNHYGKEDVAMFDFTSIHQAENASRIVERRGKRLLLGIAGDVLLEPFWPTGSGCARGFLGAFDIAWMIRGLGTGKESLDLLQERESIFTLLPQTKPDTLLRYHDKYSIDPNTRYANLNSRVLPKEQVKHLLDMTSTTFQLGNWEEKGANKSKSIQVEKKKKIDDDELVDPKLLLHWCQKQTENYPYLKLDDLDVSWKNGLGFCALINRFRPDILDYFTLDMNDAEGNCEKAFLAAEEHLGIPPKLSSHDLASQKSPDKLALLAYISSYYEALKNETPAVIIEANELTNNLNTSHYHSNNPSSQTHTYYAFTGVLKSNISQDNTNSNIMEDSMIGSNTSDVSYMSLTSTSGLYVALVSQKPAVTNKETMRNGERANPLKSATSKATILNRLSKRTKKKKARFSKKSSRDKESKSVLNDSGVSLQSFDKIPSNDTTLSSTDMSGLSSNEPSPVKKNFPITKQQQTNGKLSPVNQVVQDIPANKSLVDYKNEKNIQATTGPDKYKRISQLAESVFGDTIVQKSSSPVPKKKSSTEDLTESEKCYFCGRKVYVMERQSAEGLFFHRTCFRCCVCKCQLHIGDYIFDPSDDETDIGGKFYCKVDYSQIVYKKRTPKVEKSPEKKKRPVTQVIDTSAFKNLQGSPVSSRQVKDVQEKSRENHHGLDLRKTKSNVTDMKRTKVIERDFADGDSDDESGPYTRLSANDNLLDRHPSLMRCSPKKVTTTTFFTASKFSTSTPNLTKLIQEDSIFEEERKRQAEKYIHSKKKVVSYQPDVPADSAPQKDLQKSPVKKKLSVPSDLVATVYGNDKGDADEQVGYRERFASYNVIPDETVGAVHRRPEHEKRAQYPVSMAFTDSAIASGLKPVMVEIDVDSVFGKQDDVEVKPSTEEKAPKKKKLKLRKKKGKKLAADTIPETDESQLSPIKEVSPRPNFPTEEPSTPSIVIDDIHLEDVVPDFGKKTQTISDSAMPVPPVPSVTEQNESSRSSSSEDEIFEAKEKKGFFKKSKPGKKKKKNMSAAEKVAQEEKEKRREKRKIRKELREREMKRLWEAQSIQRKMNEVDVKQFELEERAVYVEKRLRDEKINTSDRHDLMMEWIHLVNEKNLLLRFESELVIQSNSIQLEDRHARLEQQIRDLLTSEKPKPGDRVEIDRLTKELVDVVEQRNALVEMLEEDRLREMEEDKNIKATFAKKSHDLGMDRLI